MGIGPTIFAILCGLAFLANAAETALEQHISRQNFCMIIGVTAMLHALVFVAFLLAWVFWCAIVVFPTLEPYIWAKAWPPTAVFVVSFGGLAAAGVLMGAFWLGGYVAALPARMNIRHSFFAV